MAGRKAKTGQLLLVGALAVGLGYLLGTWALNLLLPKPQLPERKQPVVTDAQGEEFSDAIAPQEKPKAPRVVPEEAPQQPTQNLEEEPVEPSMWRVVVGNYSSASQLEQALAQLQAAGYETLPLRGELQVQIGIFQDKQRADSLAEQLSGQGFPARVEEKAGR